MTISRLFIITLAALAVSAALEPGIAWAAASDDWTKPAEGIIDTLRSGAVRLGAGLIGLSVIGYGLWTIASGQPNLARVAVMIFGGLCVMAGPAMIEAILDTVQ